MKYTDNEMSVILLSSYVGISADSNVKPLSLGEWNSFFEAILKAKLEPCIVFNSDGLDLKNMGYDQQFIERVNKLVDRGASVSFELQEYEKKGISVVTEINKDYPIMLKRELKKKKPPILFYAGDLMLAKKVGIGVVGSRNVSDDGFEFTKELVKKASSENLMIYSGGAKGVDSTSETVALNEGGAVVSYIANSLVSKIKNTTVATSIANGSMLLLSDQKPDAGFSAGRAMNRNKFIYASAYGTFVVESDYNKGGTWTGATEAMKNKWGKVFVYENNLEGNKKLIERGGIPYHISEKKLYNIMTEASNEEDGEQISYEQMNLSVFLKQ
jgi:predicted Rossmann fold nucleotide-binding protein DprA/Smf involved in DNA uptake